MNSLHAHAALPRTLLTCVAAFTCTATLVAATLPHPVPRDDFWVTDGPVLALLEHNNTLYVGGNFVNVGPNTGNGAILTGAGETPDTSWPRLRATVYAAVPDSAGGWFVGGDSFTENEPNPNGGITRYLLTRLKSDRTVDANFNPQPNGQVYTMLRDGNTLFVGGNFNSLGEQFRNRLAAIDLNNGQVTTWHPDVDSYVYALARSGNTLYIAGAFTAVGGQERRGLAAVDATTGALQAFPALNFGGIGHALLVSGNTLYVGGVFTTIGGVSRPGLAAINLTDGSVIEAFNAGLADPSQIVLTLAKSDTTLYAGGTFSSMGGVDSEALAALDPATGANLGLDLNPSHFGSANVSSLALNGTDLYIGGRFDLLGGVNRNYLAKLNTQNNQLQSWHPRVAGGTFPGQVMHLVAHDGNNLFAGGSFASVGALKRTYLAAFDLASGQATSWAPNPSDGVFALAQHGGNIYVGGQFGEIGGSTRFSLAAIDPNGAVLPFNPAPGLSVYALLVDGDTLYAGGGFQGISGRERLAAFDLTSGNLTAWNPMANSTVYALALEGNTLYAGGDFTAIGGQTRNYIGAVDTTSGQATSWNPNANWTVLSLAVGQNEVFAGGIYQMIGGQNRKGLAALNKTTGQATAWDPDPNHSAIRLLQASGNHLVVGGNSLYGIGGALLGYAAAVDATTGRAVNLDLQIHPSIIFAGYRGERHFYIGGDQSGSRDQPRPNLSVHPLAPFLHSPQAQPGGQASLQLDGLPEQEYAVEYSTDFAVWNFLGTYSHASGMIIVNDPGASGQPHRFYRATEVLPR
jgi:trimeric autotransporter adhesin